MIPARLVRRRLIWKPAGTALLVGVCIGLGGIAFSWIAVAHQPLTNVIPLTVHTPHSGFNRMVVSLTLCAPGTKRCATIDDVMVDTGSTGLRIEASSLPPWLGLPPFLGRRGRPLAECLRFVHDVAWGPLYRTNLQLGGETALDLPIQIVQDNDRSRPASCPHSDVRPTSNGTLGLGTHLLDCLGRCEQNPIRPGVFINEAGVWMGVVGAVDVGDRLPNPISRLPRHNNGFVLDLPAPPFPGAIKVVGTLTLGVGTAANNRLDSARIVRLDNTGRFTTFYAGVAYPESYFDSGTETYVLNEDRLPRCPGLTWAFCSESARRLPATVIGADGAQVPLCFTIGNYQAVRQRRFGASDGVAVAADHGSPAFVWGAPFFLGRRVFVVRDGSGVPGVDKLVGPFYAIP